MSDIPFDAEDLNEGMLDRQIESHEFEKQRPRNEVWDALAEIFGAPTTRTNRTLRGKIVSSLKEAGATRDDIYRRAQAWGFHFPGATLTETALEKHWDRLDRPPLRATESQVRQYEKALNREDVRRRLEP